MPPQLAKGAKKVVLKDPLTGCPCPPWNGVTLDVTREERLQSRRGSSILNSRTTFRDEIPFQRIMHVEQDPFNPMKLIVLTNTPTYSFKSEEDSSKLEVVSLPFDSSVVD